MIPGREFDFLLGSDWQITNRVLEQRLVGCERWEEFPARLVQPTPILGGLGNMDHFVGERGGEPFEAASFRVFDPVDELWNIYWLDNRSYRINHQVTGSFQGSQGDFFGRESFGGRPVDLRFRWTGIGDLVPRWEQAYRAAESEAWETNWIMEFRRFGPG